tara:strand:+ start:6860 stop:8116 length:1257 start_codon:yes stop_codon:yes gene_type:complete
MEANNMWEDVYRNEHVNTQMAPHMSLHCHVFNMLGKYGNVCGKFSIYKNLDNLFFSDNCKKELVLFEKTQKTYYTLLKFVNLCKIKRMSVKVNSDLLLNEISLNDKNTVCIYQNTGMYYFSVRDLINICNSALIFSCDFFAEPYMPKNPYTNMPFTKGILLKIYNSIRYSSYKIPILLELFYRQQFDLELFVLKYEPIIRDECIDHFMKKGDIDEKCDYIYDILSMKYYHRYLVIDDDFPKDILVKAFEPILYNYLLAEHSLLSTHKRWKKRCIMKYMLRKFIDNNITFGRRKTLFKKPSFGVLYSKPVTYTNFMCNYIPVDKNITIPKEKQKAKEFFKYINEYESESEDSGNEHVNSDEESYDSINIIINASNSDNQVTPNINSSDVSGENSEIIMDDLFKNDSEWDDLINDTDSVS